MKKIIFLFIVLIMATNCLFAQMDERIKELDDKLTKLSLIEATGLNDDVDITLANSSLQTFLAGLGKTHKLNITADPTIEQNISLNITSEKVKNVLLFLCQKYNLDIQNTGAILSVVRYNKEIPRPIQKEAKIEYNTFNNLITLDLQNDSLVTVAKKIAKLTNTNILISPLLKDKVVNGYIQNTSLEDALEKLAFSNDFDISKTSDKSFNIVTKTTSSNTNTSNTNNNFSTTNSNTKSTNNSNTGLSIKVSSANADEKVFTIQATNQPITQIIKELSQQAGINYVLSAEPQGNITLKAENQTYDQLMATLLQGTEYTCNKMDDLYLIGKRKDEGLRETKVIQIQHRTLKDVIEAIPKELSSNVQIQPFVELNSVILSGSEPNIAEIERFILAIDKPVPVVMIEVTIVDIIRSYDVKGGIKAGLGTKPATTGGTILPGIDITLGSGILNDFLKIIGLNNIGRVLPEFYVGLQALENNGYIDIQSTPKLATLNGHKATLSIGKTSYYVEQNQNVVGVQNPQTIVTNVYKSVNADFTIDIEPVVSGNEQVTLNITVSQSDFSGRSVPGAPPDQTTRKFQSMIRLKNEEMIVLGGLERNQKGETGSGLPGIARVPILNWIFGQRQRNKEKSKLIVLIKPTVFY